ncbi:MAG: hypothetical protein ACRDU8_03760 [Egibacteraceae bacterium]
MDPFQRADHADEFDSAAEVDANFRTQRRIAVGYFAVFLVVMFGVPALTLVLDWWSAGRLLGGMSPNFVMGAAGLYLFLIALAAAAATLANAVEDRMLGGRPEGLDEEPPPPPVKWRGDRARR